MARLTIEDKWWTDPRRSKLIKLLGDEDQADLAALRLWKLAQRFWGDGHKPIPYDLFEILEAAPKLVEAKLAFVEADGVYVKGSKDFLSWLSDARQAASRGGKKSAAVRLAKTGSAQPKAKKVEADPNPFRSNVDPSGSGSVFGSDSGSGSDSDSEKKDIAGVVAEAPHHASVNPDGHSPTAMVWRAYKKAYEEKHGAAPPWNAKTAGQIKSFVSRVPAEEAPEIAAFFLSHPDSFYVRSKHSIGLLLRDAEKLRTEWITGRRVTGAQARAGEDGDFHRDQLRRIAAGDL